jgi:hypothetical protein
VRTYIESAAHSHKVLAKMQSAEQHWPEPRQGFVNENHPQLFVCDAYTFVEFFQNVLLLGEPLRSLHVLCQALALSMNGNVAALAGLVLGKQEAQQEHQCGSGSEQPVDIDVGECLSLGHHHAVHSGKRLLVSGVHA